MPCPGASTFTTHGPYRRARTRCCPTSRSSRIGPVGQLMRWNLRRTIVSSSVADPVSHRSRRDGRSCPTTPYFRSDRHAVKASVTSDVCASRGLQGSRPTPVHTRCSVDGVAGDEVSLGPEPSSRARRRPLMSVPIEGSAPSTEAPSIPRGRHGHDHHPGVGSTHLGGTSLVEDHTSTAPELTGSSARTEHGTPCGTIRQGAFSPPR